jgi:hypothetical protein
MMRATLFCEIKRRKRVALTQQAFGERFGKLQHQTGPPLVVIYVSFYYSMAESSVTSLAVSHFQLPCLPSAGRISRPPNKLAVVKEHPAEFCRNLTVDSLESFSRKSESRGYEAETLHVTDLLDRDPIDRRRLVKST